jgi:hypothetical protein
MPNLRPSGIRDLGIRFQLQKMAIVTIVKIVKLNANYSI